jgi:hypothetical protein
VDDGEDDDDDDDGEEEEDDDEDAGDVSSEGAAAAGTRTRTVGWGGESGAVEEEGEKGGRTRLSPSSKLLTSPSNGPTME